MSSCATVLYITHSGRIDTTDEQHRETRNLFFGFAVQEGLASLRERRSAVFGCRVSLAALAQLRRIARGAAGRSAPLRGDRTGRGGEGGLGSRGQRTSGWSVRSCVDPCSGCGCPAE